MIVFTESTKESVEKLLELINEFGKIAKYKISKQKSGIFLYDSNKKIENEKIVVILFTIVSINIEYRIYS